MDLAIQTLKPAEPPAPGRRDRASADTGRSFDEMLEAAAEPEGEPLAGDGIAVPAAVPAESPAPGAALAVPQMLLDTGLATDDAAPTPTDPAADPVAEMPAAPDGGPAPSPAPATAAPPGAQAQPAAGAQPSGDLAQLAAQGAGSTEAAATPEGAAAPAEAALPDTAPVEDRKDTRPSADAAGASRPALPPPGTDAPRAAAAAESAAPRNLVAVNVPPGHVAIHIARAAGSGADRISIQLSPASLGQVDVELEVAQDGRVDAVVRVERPETLELLQRDARQLVRALQDAGLKADGGSLDFQLQGDGQQQQQQRQSAAMTPAPGHEPGRDARAAASIPLIEPARLGRGVVDMRV